MNQCDVCTDIKHYIISAKQEAGFYMQHFSVQVHHIKLYLWLYMVTFLYKYVITEIWALLPLLWPHTHSASIVSVPSSCLWRCRHLPLTELLEALHYSTRTLYSNHSHYAFSFSPRFPPVNTHASISPYMSSPFPSTLLSPEVHLQKSSFHRSLK